MSNVIAGSLAGKFPDGTETKICLTCRKRIGTLNSYPIPRFIARWLTKLIWRRWHEKGSCPHVY